MNQDLARALELVEHDLRVEPAPVPKVRDEEWSGDLRRPSAMLTDVAGNSQGVSCSVDDGPAEQLRSVADRVQEWVHEELCRVKLPVAWPRCPAHPRTHPLSAVVVDETAWWVCPLDQRRTSPVGRLDITARSSRPGRGGR